MKEELEGALSEAKKERVPIDSIPESQQIELDNLTDSAKLDLEASLLCRRS